MLAPVDTVRHMHTSRIVPRRAAFDGVKGPRVPAAERIESRPVYLAVGNLLLHMRVRKLATYVVVVCRQHPQHSSAVTITTCAA